MNNIAIFASGSGSNAENIINHFKGSDLAKVDLLLCNRPDAFALTRAKNLGVDTLIFGREDFYNSDVIINELARRGIDYIVLAGFLWLVPDSLTKKYEGRIVNIHPALLPKFGGKGMYGDRVHKAVIEAGEKESGITIHLVNSIYDSGDIIFQAKTPVTPEDDYKSLAAKIHELEGEHFPRIIEQEIRKIM